MIVNAQQNDTVDAICWRHYGKTAGVVEQVLLANPGLADYGAVLPIGVRVELPELAAAKKQKLIQLWD